MTQLLCWIPGKRKAPFSSQEKGVRGMSSLESLKLNSPTSPSLDKRGGV